MRKPTKSDLTRAENVDQLMERSKGGVGERSFCDCLFCKLLCCMHNTTVRALAMGGAGESCAWPGEGGWVRWSSH